MHRYVLPDRAVENLGSLPTHPEVRVLNDKMVFRHFKGNHYVILGIGKHTETDEECVIYTRVEKDLDTIWVRPKSMFLELVDKEKYPDATQRYRFEFINHFSILVVWNLMK